MKNVFVLCPGNSVSGGPELLHQLVDEINNSQSARASIVYYPFKQSYKVPEAYSHYNIDIKTLNNIYDSDCTVVIPEVKTKYVKKFKGKNIAVWWMSVDNYLGLHWLGTSKEKLKHKWDILKGSKLAVNNMANVTHLVQSHYAMEFINSYGLPAVMLSDFLNEEHLNSDITNPKRENVIAYNPKKGVALTQGLIASFPQFKFVPIQNMTSKEVKQLLNLAKVYIDFGEHPGKDRFPREAVMAGCCIITGRKGSALNNIDVPLLDKYKIYESDPEFNSKFKFLIDEIFENYSGNYHDFLDYRQKIINEHDIFKEQVTDYIRSI